MLQLQEHYRFYELNEDDAANARLVTIVASVCKLRAKTRARSTSSNASLMSEAIGVAFQLEHWRVTVPACLAFSTIGPVEPSPATLSHHFHSYRDLWNAAVHNSFRALQILVHSTIVKGMVPNDLGQQPCDESGRGDDVFAWIPSPSSHADQIQFSRIVIQENINDICASVPFHLSTHAVSPSADVSISVNAPPPSAAANSLIWPLFIAGTTRFCPVTTRTWIIGRLQYIGTAMAVRQASMMADVVARHRDMPELSDSDEND